MLVAGCGGLHLNDYANASPRFDPFRYFDGSTRAWGIVQDWRGRVIRRFDVAIEGRVENETLILDESFAYADGERSKRIWRIRRQGDGTLTGRADDIIGDATGATEGNSMRFRYSMDLPVGDSRYRVHFDDWMWQLDDAVLVNRSTISKFGVTVGEVTLFMQRKSG